jgi:hypothetical protein
VEINDSRGVLISKFEVMCLCYVTFAIYSDIQCFEQCGKYIVVTNVLRTAGNMPCYGKKR